MREIAADEHGCKQLLPLQFSEVEDQLSASLKATI